MPTDNGLRLEYLWRIQRRGRQAIEPAKYQAIDFAKDRPVRRSTAQNIDLVAKNEDFGLQCRPRPEQPGYSESDEPEELPIGLTINRFAG
jgi:hypothetical protein